MCGLYEILLKYLRSPVFVHPGLNLEPTDVVNVNDICWRIVPSHHPSDVTTESIVFSACSVCMSAVSVRLSGNFNLACNILNPYKVQSLLFLRIFLRSLSTTIRCQLYSPYDPGRDPVGSPVPWIKKKHQQQNLFILNTNSPWIHPDRWTCARNTIAIRLLVFDIVC